MKKYCSLLVSSLVLLTCRIAIATQADDTVITIDSQTPGATPFLSQLTLTASDTSVIKSVQFAIMPKVDAVARPLSGTYSTDYLVERGYLNSETGQIFLPVYGLYANYANTVTLTYRFKDGSLSEDSTNIATSSFADPCGYDPPTILAQSNATHLSYDYIMFKNDCSFFAPAVIDTDGALRWVGTANVNGVTAAFFDNAVYQVQETILYRIDLDGTVTQLHDYADDGITLLHHNIDRGKVGLLLEGETATQVESTVLEVDAAGDVQKIWSMADIITDAMNAGGDDPTQFVYSAPFDWFHLNSTTYNRADDSLLVSSRENFVIALDYESSTIKWILGDPTKKWYEFESLRQYALDLSPGSLPPIGQHGLSISYDQNLLLFDNGFASFFQMPPGEDRGYASPRKYRLDLEAQTATEVWNYEMDQSIYSPICGSIYEDAPLHYLVDYADVNGPLAQVQYAQVLGLSPDEDQIFYYQYPTIQCTQVFNAIPLHLESTSFPAILPRALNVSTRGLIGNDQASLIGGFIVTGTADKTVVLRALGPSLGDAGLLGVSADPVLTVFDSTGTAIASNDDWQSDPGAGQIIADGLAPTDPAEAATIRTLAPGAYTFVVTGKDATPGIGLVEAYDRLATGGFKTGQP